MSEWLVYLRENFANPDAAIGIVFYALVTIVIVVVVSALVKRILMRVSEKSLARLKIDETSYRFMRGILTLMIYFGGAIIFVSLVPRLHALMSALLASAGIAAIVIGLAAQNTLSNIVAGILITIFRPVRIKDSVKIGEDFGKVEDITLMYTVIRTWDYRRLVIPNSMVASTVIVNYSHTDSRLLVHVEIGISYDSDIDKARAIMIEEAQKCEFRLQDAPDEPYVRVIEVGEYAIGMRLYMWIKDPDVLFRTKFGLMESIKKRFDREGVEIPFPYRTIVYKKDMAPAA
jgi:small-conductance mechanosensitive channel